VWEGHGGGGRVNGAWVAAVRALGLCAAGVGEGFGRLFTSRVQLVQPAVCSSERGVRAGTLVCATCINSHDHPSHSPARVLRQHYLHQPPQPSPTPTRAIAVPLQISEVVSYHRVADLPAKTDLFIQVGECGVWCLSQRGRAAPGWVLLVLL